jgi:hypothetical protein
MRLLRLSEAELSPNDHVFRHARMRASIVWLAVFCGAAAMFFLITCVRIQELPTRFP